VTSTWVGQAQADPPGPHRHGRRTADQDSIAGPDAAFQPAKHRLAGRPRPVTVLASVTGVLVPVEIALWAFTGGGSF
jgi:hypothetical protein